jgi:group I intron endonuclease
MSLKKSKSNNPLFGKDHSEETKELMRQKALGRKHYEETKLLMSTKRGIITEVYEKSGTGFKLIGSFTSARQACKYLGISASTSTINKYLKSGEIFKNKYKFKSQFVQESK